MLPYTEGKLQVGTHDLSGLGSDPHKGDASHATANHAPKQTGKAFIVVRFRGRFTVLVLDIGGTEVPVGGGGEYENVGGEEVQQIHATHSTVRS